MNNKSLIAITLILALFLAVKPARAEIKLLDPMIPDGERIVYSFRMGDSTTTLMEKVRVREGDNYSVYEVISKSAFMDKHIKIDRKAMRLFYLSVTSKTEKTVVKRTTTLIKDEVKPKKNRVRILDYFALNCILRFIPFDRKKPIKFIITGNKGGVPLKLKVDDIEDIEIGDKTIKCYKLELGVGGLMSLVFPKSYFWYSYDKPHYLVRSESPRNPMGSPKQVMELIEYKGGD